MADSDKYAWSEDGENYRGLFPSIDAACDDALSELEDGAEFWVGRGIPPLHPEYMWNAEDWIEHVNCQDEYLNDAAEGWGVVPRELLTELEREVRSVLAAWLDRHGLRPTHYNVTDARKYEIRCVNDGGGHFDRWVESLH